LIPPRAAVALVLVLAVGGTLVLPPGCGGAPPRRGAAASPGVLPRPVSPVEHAEPWSFAGRDGQFVRTPNYRIWTTELDPVILGRLPIFLERAMEHYRTDLGPLPPPADRLDTFVLSTRHQWELLTRQTMGEHADVYLRIPRGGYAWAGRSILYDIGAQGTMAIAAHEGWHQYTQRTFRDALPIWLEEGIASYMEGHRWGGWGGSESGATPVFLGWANVERFDQLRAAAAAGTLMPLTELLDATPQSLLGSAPDGVLTYYAQVWALIHFLREAEDGRYRPALERLVADAAAGRLHRALAASAGAAPARRAMLTRRGALAFVAYFTPDLDEAQRQYAAFITDLVAPGARNAIVEGRSPVQSGTR